MSRRHTSRTAPRRDPESFMRRTERFPQDVEPLPKSLKRAAIVTGSVFAATLISLALYAALLQWVISI